MRPTQDECPRPRGSFVTIAALGLVLITSPASGQVVVYSNGPVREVTTFDGRTLTHEITGLGYGERTTADVRDLDLAALRTETAADFSVSALVISCKNSSECLSRGGAFADTTRLPGATASHRASSTTIRCTPADCMRLRTALLGTAPQGTSVAPLNPRIPCRIDFTRNPPTEEFCDDPQVPEEARQPPSTQRGGQPQVQLSPECMKESSEWARAGGDPDRMPACMKATLDEASRSGPTAPAPGTPTTPSSDPPAPQPPSEIVFARDLRGTSWTATVHNYPDDHPLSVVFDASNTGRSIYRSVRYDVTWRQRGRFVELQTTPNARGCSWTLRGALDASDVDLMKGRLTVSGSGCDAGAWDTTARIVKR